MAHNDLREDDGEKKSEGLGARISAYTDSALYRLSASGTTLDLQGGGLRIMDLCCGKGMATAPFRKGNELFYLDLSSEMVEAGKEEGYIDVPEERILIGEAGEILDSPKVKLLGGSVDFVVNRFSFHDFTKASYQHFCRDQECFYRTSKRFQTNILGLIRELLVPGGELQIIDVAVPAGLSSEVKRFYNHYHMLKTTKRPIGVHIPTVRELSEMLRECKFRILDVSWYGSSVSLREWYEEGQITKGRFRKLRELFKWGKSQKELREAFKIKRGRDGLEATFPVVVFTGVK